MAKEKGEIKILAENRKARYDYSIIESLECGIELVGTEVKSLKTGRFSFTDSYARIKEGELFLVGFHITPYPFGNLFNHDPDRERRLLAHKQEIKRLKRKTDEKGYTLIPLRIYLKKGYVKLEIGIAVGKKMHDKREAIKERDQKRDLQREMRSRV